MKVYHNFGENRFRLEWEKQIFMPLVILADED
jgi:hypothetical protein